MASGKILYWAVLAVLAAFVGNHFANKYNGGCLADRAMTAVQGLSGEAAHFVAMARDVIGGTPRFAGPELAVAQVQSHFASLQAEVARQQAACARLEAQRARMMALQQMQHVRVGVICPRQNLSVEIPRVPVVVSDGTI